MQENREHQSFHVGLKAFIANGNKLLVLQDQDGLWELPGGRTEKTEIHKDLQEILAREVAEELGQSIQYEIGSIFHAWIRKPEQIKENIFNQHSQNTDFCIF
jgi:8-oxo-dGTP pyrophosphatase MutT (NUDIX family)